MRMKPVGLVFAAITLVVFFLVSDYESADAELKSFYTKMLTADFSGACKSIDEAIRLWPGNSRYYTWRAYCRSQKLPSLCLLASGEAGIGLRSQDQVSARAAVDDYRRALELNSHDGVAYHNLAWLEHLLGEDKAAVKDWAAAISIDPSNALFHLSYGMFLEEMGEISKSREEYLTAIELSPQILDSPFFQQYRLRSPDGPKHVVTEAITRAESKLLQARDAILEARLGKFYLYRGNLVQSRQLLEDAAQQLPNLPLVWLNLGQIHQEQGDSPEAETCFRKALGIDGSLAGAYRRLGEIEITSSRESAAQNFRLAIQMWQHANPITAAHNNRLYSGPPQLIDDLLPTTLVWYTTPCDASPAWRGLAQLFPEKPEYATRSQICEQLPAPHHLK